MNIVKHYLTKNRCYMAGKTIKPKGIMLHSVGCPQPKAMVFVDSWNRFSAAACVHAFIDANTGNIYQTLPWNHRGWHGGGSSNNTHIGVEMCEPNVIKYTGGSTFTCSDLETAQAMVKRTYDAAVELFAFLCDKYDLDPTADGVIISHREGHKRGIASNHGDPEHLWNGLGMGYTMNGFRRDVKAAMEGKKQIPVNGIWDSTLTKRLQEIFGTIADGVISNQHSVYKASNPGLGSGWDWKTKPNGKGSMLIAKLQSWAGMPSRMWDGEFGPNTCKAIQKKLGTVQDGHVSKPSNMVKALQRWANAQ